MNAALCHVVGRFVIWKYRQRAYDCLGRSTAHSVALQLRKQGFPLPLARLIILGVV